MNSRPKNPKYARNKNILVVGGSGSGKTTFSRLVNGLIPNYYEGMLTGEISVVGKIPEETEFYELTPYVGSVFQNPKVQFYTLSVDTEIVFSCENMGLEKEEILSRFDTTVHSMQLESLLERNLFTLSGGEKQKVACASVYAQIPEIFVLDEPTSNLDIGTIRELHKILQLWKKEGKTIPVAEHRLNWVREIADRVVYFNNGKIEHIFSGEKFFRKEPDTLHNMGLRGEDSFTPRCVGLKRIEDTLEFRNFSFSIKKNQLFHIDSLKIPI